MLARLIFLFVLTSMIEVSLLWIIFEHTGFLFTIALIITTGVIGASLAHRQGIQCLSRIQRELSQGHLPGDSLVDGLMILIAAVVLITPGVLTDFLGFCLLVPPIRAILKRLVVARFKHRIVVSGFSASPQQKTQFDDVIDVEHRPADSSETD